MSSNTAGLPGVPRFLRANLHGHTKVIIDWDKPSDDGGSPITGYKIYKGTTNVVFAGDVNADVFSKYFTSLSAGYTYNFQVSAVNANGEGPKTNRVSKTPNNSQTRAAYVPSRVINLTAEPTTELGEVTLQWNAPANLGNTDLIEYQIHRALEGQTLAKIGTTDKDTLTYTDSNLENETAYDYVLIARNSMGNSEPSDIVTVTTIPEPIPEPVDPPEPDPVEPPVDTTPPEPETPTETPDTAPGALSQPLYGDSDSIYNDIDENSVSAATAIKLLVIRANENASYELVELFMGNYSPPTVDPETAELWFRALATELATSYFWVMSNNTDEARAHREEVRDKARMILVQRFKPAFSVS